MIMFMILLPGHAAGSLDRGLVLENLHDHHHNNHDNYDIMTIIITIMILLPDHAAGSLDRRLWCWKIFAAPPLLREQLF